ncbi:MAG: hypothetical protein ACQERJ_06950 [Bacillota bacterium]
MRKIDGLFKNIISDKNIWILFLVFSSFHFKIVLDNFKFWGFMFREALIFIFCWILMNDFHRRYLRKIDIGIKIEPAVNLIKYVFLGLGVLNFILLITVLNKGISDFFRNFLSLVIFANIYFQLDNIGNIFIGENYIYFDYKVLSISSLTGYEFNDNKEIIFHKDNKNVTRFKMPDISMKRKIAKELDKSKLSEI